MATEEIVELLITAENIATKELEKAAKDVKGLGNEVAKTESELDKLKIDSDVLQSYPSLISEVEKLDIALAKSVVKLKKSKKELKENKNATDEDAEAIERQSNAIAVQRKELRLRNAELIKAKDKLKEMGVSSDKIAQAEKEYAAKIDITSARLVKLNALQEDNINTEVRLRNAKRSTHAELLKQQKLQKENAKQLERSAKAALKVKKAQELSEQQAREYAKAIDILNASLKKGNITKSEYIVKEKLLRSEFKRTEAQAKATGANIDLVGSASGRAVKNTDTLTKVTRRLAQAYTVLIAAQSAGRVIAENSKEYGQLEAAQTKVLKTTDLMRSEIISMTDELIRLSEDVTPSATNELLRFAEVAGQLGVEGSDNILRMVSAADALNVSTDLAGDEAATLLTRILTMTKEGVPAIDGLASAVVELGNNTATTESEIVQMTKEIVTGTQALNLGSVASAAFGATLKEVGQRGESSRTAFTKLSNSIKQAVLEGGDDLKKLSDITGQTASQLERNLGTRPEKILFDFVKGLERVKNEGGLVSKTLGGFGVTGTEALSVISSLANNTDRLARNLKLAGDAQEAGNAHMIEAAKAYSTQDASLAKLNNKFVALKASIGEAFSDEIQNGIESIGDALDNNEESIIQFFEATVQLGEELASIGKAFVGLDKALGAILPTGSAVTTMMVGFKVLFSNFKNGISALSIVILNLVSDVLSGLQSLSGGLLDFTDELDKIEGVHDSILKSMAENNQSLIDSINDANGDSSDAYRDLLESADKYKNEIKKLDKTQRDQLETILLSNKYDEDKNDISRKITASLVALGRQTKVVAEQEEKRIESLKESKRLEIEKNHRDLAFTESQKLINDQLNITSVNLEYLRLLYRDGAISEGEFHAKSVELIDSQTQLKGALVGVLDELPKQEREVLKLNKAYGELSKASLKLLQNSIKTSSIEEKAIARLKGLTKGTDDYVSAQDDLAIAKVNSNKASAALAESLRLEGLSLNELKSLREDLIKSIEEEQKAKDNSTGSLVKYNKKLDEYAVKLAKIDKLIGESKDKKKEDTEETIRSSEANEDNRITLEELIEANNKLNKVKEESNSLIKDTTEASFELNNANDLASFSVEQLIARYDLLKNSFAGVSTAIGNLSESGRLIDGTLRRQKDFELTFISQALAAKRLEDQLKNNNLTLAQLDKMSIQVNNGFTELGDAQLDPLRQSIESARREFEQLDNTINNSLSRTQDRLDRLLGNEKDILERQFEKELEDANKLLDEAKGSGDRDSVNNAREVITNLNKIRKIERDNFKKKQEEQQATTSNTERNIEGNIDGSELASKELNRYVTINLKAPDGSTSTVKVADDGSAESLVDILSSLGDNNVNGIK